VLITQGLITLNVFRFDKSDNWQVVEKTNNKIYDKIMSIKVGIENRVNNYYPFYININNLYYNTIINIDSIYLKDIYLKNNRDGEKIFYNKDNQFYYIVNNYDENTLNERLDNQLNYYNNIASKYNNINIALYLPLRYEINSFSNINNLYDKYIYFKDNINKNIKVSALESNNIEEYFKYFYKTDHHYNSYGALKAYKDILNMFDIEDERNYSYKVILDTYYGSSAKSLLSDRISDELTAIDIKNNLKVNIDNKLFKPLEINKKDNKFYDYYVAYFNGQYDEVIYSNDKINSNNNLLIISDSLVWQIDYLLANNFNKTYVVNLRYGKWLNQNLDLDEYINNNNITHILYLQEAEEEMFDIYNFNTSKKVI